MRESKKKLEKEKEECEINHVYGCEKVKWETSIYRLKVGTKKTVHGKN